MFSLALRQAQGPPFDPAVPEPVEGRGKTYKHKNRMKKISQKKLILHILPPSPLLCKAGELP
jgi:hypothetical protein